jgi:chemotaxis protein histidine kinase CheA
MEFSKFSFVKSPTGTLSGESFVKQTEDAINGLGQQIYEVVEDNSTLSAQVQQALATANSAQSTASSALTNSQNALTQLETLTSTVNTYDQKITQAVSQSTSAVQTATAAQESAQSAQESAQAAQEAAEAASFQAQQAQTAASEAQTQAEAAQTAAEVASAQATDASKSAQQAQQQAQQAQQYAESAANSAENLVQNAVMVTEQTFVESQQTQARTNIGAAASDNAGLTGTTTAEDISASGTVTATGGFVGDLTGTASQATADGNGNNIAATYATIANTYTKAQVDAKVSSVYRFMGSVATYNDLPSSGQTVGDTYNVEDTGANYSWDGTQWDKLSETVDLSQYLLISDAASTYLTQSNAQNTYLTQLAAQSTYVPLSGGTMAGPLLLSGSPTSGQEAVTKSYVDSAVSSGTSSAVLFTSQSLSTTQQQQACTNIAAMPTQDLITVCNEIAGVA